MATHHSGQSSINEFDAKYDIVNIPTPRYTPLSGHFKKSFAYYTLRERLPVILTHIVDNLTKFKDEIVTKYGEESREELKTVIGKISELKYQLQTDKPFELFTGKAPDKEMWNRFLRSLPSNAASFYTTCWLYSECYMYRKVSSFFEETATLAQHDYFESQKQNAMIVSQDAIEKIALAIRRPEATEDMFDRLIKLCLWGNRCDLSITTGNEVRPDENPLDNLSAFDSNILINNSAAIWKCVNASGDTSSKPVIIDFVNDNAGYEFFTDLVLADYFIETKLASKIRFHVKAMPWFISDVTPNDFHWTLQYLQDHRLPVVSELGKKWSDYVRDGIFELQPTEYYWTAPFEFYIMPDVNPNLYKFFKDSQLIIFKGDLNYRKLLGDFNWDFTDHFITCLRGFQPTNLCALRTVKADLICGLHSGKAEQLFKSTQDWMSSGEYGVIQFSERSSCDCSS